jgi:hypothetical protein
LPLPRSKARHLRSFHVRRIVTGRLQYTQLRLKDPIDPNMRVLPFTDDRDFAVQSSRSLMLLPPQPSIEIGQSVGNPRRHANPNQESLLGLQQLPGGAGEIAVQCRVRLQLRPRHADIDTTGEWSIGVVVGPSGSGKTSIGRQIFGEPAPFWTPEWPQDAPIIDAIAPEGDFNAVTAALGSVGLGSVPTWLRPYPVLSNGEKFRADLARLVCDAPSPATFRRRALSGLCAAP